MPEKHKLIIAYAPRRNPVESVISRQLVGYAHNLNAHLRLPGHPNRDLDIETPYPLSPNVWLLSKGMRDAF